MRYLNALIISIFLASCSKYDFYEKISLWNVKMNPIEYESMPKDVQYLFYYDQIADTVENGNILCCSRNYAYNLDTSFVHSFEYVGSKHQGEQFLVINDKVFWGNMGFSYARNPYILHESKLYYVTEWARAPIRHEGDPPPKRTMEDMKTGEYGYFDLAMHIKSPR